MEIYGVGVFVKEGVGVGVILDVQFPLKNH